jgi:hypothetical protein
VAARPQGHRDLPRRLQAHQPLSTGRDADKTPPRDRDGLDRPAAAPGRSSPTPAARSPTSSPSQASRATSRSLYEDGKPGEIFITLGKAGSTLAGFADAFATAISFALQHGVELRFLVDKFSHARFEPSGFTGNPEIPLAKSIVDYVFRWMALRFLPKEDQPAPANGKEAIGTEIEREGAGVEARLKERERAVSAWLTRRSSECGEIMVRNGACYVRNCGPRAAARRSWPG